MQFLAAAALALSTFTTPVIATAGQGGTVIAVPTRDLDLTSAKDIDTLAARLRSAIRQACPRPDSIEVRAQLAARACVREARQLAEVRRDELVARAHEARLRLARIDE